MFTRALGYRFSEDALLRLSAQTVGGPRWPSRPRHGNTTDPDRVRHP